MWKLLKGNERLHPVFSKDKAMYGVEGYLMPIAASPIAGTPYSVNGNPIHDNAEWLYLELGVSPQLESQRTGTPASQSESRGTSH